MRTAPIVLFLSASAALAQANPITGVYGDEAGCRRLAGQPEGTDVVFILTPDRIERYESSCAINSLFALDGQETRADVTCNGEGEEWADAYVFSPLPGEDGYLIGPADYPDVRFEVRPCS